MDEPPPECFPSSSSIPSLSLTTHYDVGLDSTFTLMAQQHLIKSRITLLRSGKLSESHDFRKRVNEDNGTLLPSQPNGMARKVYDPGNIPRPRIRKEKDPTNYFLRRYRLMSMWNGQWTKDSDWADWARSKKKMERQFDDYRLVEHPIFKERRTKEHNRRERKRKRESLDPDLPGKKHRCDENSGKQKSRSNAILPTPAEVLAVIPLEGIRIERLLERFWKPKEWDTELFCTMLHEIGTLNKFTKMFTGGKMMEIGQVEKGSRIVGFGDGDIPIDPQLLNTSPGNACIEGSKVEVC